jgi:predicted phage terminase large subunit-like protein
MDNVNEYQPSVEALKFINFIKLCNVEENSNAPMHMILADKVMSKHSRIAVEQFRGSSKSTIAGEYVALYAGTMGKLPNFGVVNFMVGVFDSAEGGAKNFIRNITSKIDSSEFLSQQLKVKRVTQNELELVNSAGHQLNIRTYGASTNIRGVRYNNMRPELVVIDDVVTNEASKSETMMNTIEDNIYKAIIPAVNPTKNKIIFIGTPHNQKDVLYKAIQSGTWNVSKFPVCKEFPCSRAEFEGMWEDRFDYDFVKQTYEMYKANGQENAFMQEFMLVIIDEGSRLVRDEDITWYKFSDMKKGLDNLNYVITTDLATTEKKSADWSVISVWGINNNNDRILVDMISKRQTTSKSINDIFNLVGKWKPMYVGLEKDGQQKAIIEHIKSEMINRNIFFNLARDKKSNSEGLGSGGKSKVARFNAVQPLFAQGKIWFPEDILKDEVGRLYSEISTLTSEGFKSQHDDHADTVSQLGLMEHLIIPPSVDSMSYVEQEAYYENVSNSYLIN